MKIKEIFTSFIKKFKEDSNFRLLSLAIAAGAVVLISVIIILIVINHNNNEPDVPVDTDLAVAVTPQATPTPEATPSPTLTPTPTPSPTPEPTPTPDLHPGKVQSHLTGEWVDEAQNKVRPYAIMFNNIGVANPQSGIGEAKILYEALVEGGITRLMGIYDDLTEDSACAGRIGSVRSARHYYASIADEYDAIYIHFGRTTYAEKKIKKLKINDIEGLYDNAFYRDNEIKAPHNAFASLAGIQKVIKNKGYRTEHPDGYEPNHFIFSEELAVPVSDKSAVNISFGYSDYITAKFTYDEAAGLYLREEFGGPHIDYNTGEQLKFTNILVQVVHEYNKDKNGYQEMDIADNSGEGYYISQGKCVPITWTKNEKSRYMMYFDENNQPLCINPGKTFISVYPDFRLDKLVIE